jgi:hypothetical protein
MDILRAPLPPNKPLGHHVLGGLIPQARALLLLRDLLLLSPLHLLQPLLPHKTNDPFCQDFVVLDFLVKFSSNSWTSLLTFESAYECIHLLIKLEISNNRRGIDHDIPFQRGLIHHPPPPLDPPPMTTSPA